MHFWQTLSVLALASTVTAQTSSSTSICDRYATALYGNNTAASQYALMVLLVNTFMAGNYQSQRAVKVTGVLNAGAINGTSVDLLPYFNGSLVSSLIALKGPVQVNFLDGGGVTPLFSNLSANSIDTYQNTLMTHQYQYFGGLLGCSQQGQGATFPVYEGQSGMFDVHRYMALNHAQVSYFIEQVGLAASSLAFAASDVTSITQALNTIFNYRCAPRAELLNLVDDELQSICVTDDCPLASQSNCNLYPAIVQPQAASLKGTSVSSSSGGSSSTAGSSSGSSPTAGSSSAPSSSGAASSSSGTTLSSSVTAAAGAGATSSPSPVPGGTVLSGGAIAGIVVGALALLCILAGGIFLCRRRSSSRGRNSRVVPSVALPFRRPEMTSGDISPGASALNADNLDRHLAGEEWAGIRREVPQKQTAYLNVVSRGAADHARNGRDGDGLSDFSELRPQDAAGESRYEPDVASRVHSEEPLTAMYPASETVFHHRA